MNDYNAEVNKTNIEKWNYYYINAEQKKTSPPWESSEVFHALKDWLLEDSSYDESLLKFSIQKPFKIIELGSGASSSSIWLAQLGHEIYALDISPEAIKRAKLFDMDNKVNWVEADILDENLFNFNKEIQKESFDIVFDLQCFHVLRTVNSKRTCEVIFNLLKKGGKLMIVVGATLHPYTRDNPILSTENSNGPPKISIDDFLIPLTKVGLKAISIKLSRFNKTSSYGDSPPLCWVGIFEK